MSRKERKNMISFISRIRGMEESKLSIMTDDEVEHIYERTYYSHETITE
ncbi:BH0509 family protein [Bacillus sp. FJAT-44742]|nr:BH0509 family protein [Bacillus sp. FJAT-44742]